MTDCCRSTLADRPATPGQRTTCAGCGERWEVRGGVWIITGGGA